MNEDGRTGATMTDDAGTDRGTVGVVGAGVMGTGVALALAQAGHRVVLVDTHDDVLERAQAEMRKSLRMARLFSKGAGASSDGDPLERIVGTTDDETLCQASFVIENVTERWEVKEPVYRRLDALCPEDCVIGANTSCISITRLGGATGRADRVVGMHFMNPVALKGTIEVIRGHHTSDETLERAKELLATLEKDCIVVEDLPGFVSNRVLMLTINEAIWVVFDAVAPAEDVDRLFKSCFGHKMGPLETADLIGLDTILDSLLVLHQSYGDTKFRPCPLLTKMVDAGLLGRKSGRGFYHYDLPE